MRTITCFGDRTSGTFLIIASVSRTDNFVNVTSPRVLSYRSALHYFLTMPVDFIFIKPQVGGIKIATL